MSAEDTVINGYQKRGKEGINIGKLGGIVCTSVNSLQTFFFCTNNTWKSLSY